MGAARGTRDSVLPRARGSGCFLQGWSGIDENHHVAEALRLAQIKALRAVLKRFDDKTDTDPFRKDREARFSAALSRFLNEETRLAQRAFARNAAARDEQAVRAAVLSRLSDAFDQSLAATTQNNVGNALVELGERESGTARLLEAVAALRAALAEWARDRVPLDWAMAHNNLGVVLQTLGERESDPTRLLASVEVLRAALEERTRERVPLDRGITQHNLGNSLKTLGERGGGTTMLKQAAEAYRAALEVLTPQDASHYHAMTTVNLGEALAEIASRKAAVSRGLIT